MTQLSFSSNRPADATAQHVASLWLHSWNASPRPSISYGSLCQVHDVLSLAFERVLLDTLPALRQAKRALAWLLLSILTTVCAILQGPPHAASAILAGTPAHQVISSSLTIKAASGCNVNGAVTGALHIAPRVTCSADDCTDHLLCWCLHRPPSLQILMSKAATQNSYEGVEEQARMS
jgi:hypothetical protein